MPEGEKEWKPLFSFGIDDGELDGLKPVDCFTLGYEVAMVREVYAVRPEGFVGPIHSDNVQRIHRALNNAKRNYSMEWMPNDPSEAWMQLTIDPK